MKRGLAILFALGILTACQEDVQIAKPGAVTLTPEAAGHYCQMAVLEHTGPKAQIHLTGLANPFWFTQVRDAVAFRISPEEPKNIAAIYVNDMDKAASWENPGADNWIDAEAAWFVIDSKMGGGMGAPEAIPFGTEAGAQAFAQKYMGSVVRLNDIPADYVLAPIEMTSAAGLGADGKTTRAKQ